jgi:CHAT domain-containing protein
LHLVPFDALVRDDGAYWGAKQIISEAPSASTEFLLRAREEQYRYGGKRFLGIGGVNYELAKSGGNNAQPAKGPTDAERPAEDDFVDRTRLKQLPGSVEEVKSAAQLMGPDAQLELGNDATKTAFYAAKPGSYGIIHFAVHAFTDIKQPDHAALVLRDDPPRTDGLLDAGEIMRLHLRSQLVVLSACDTAVGRLQGEEGIANMTRAWLAAGAESVVSTLWSVNDTFSLYLMKRFYAHLAEGRDKAQSLHDAKVDLLSQFGEDTPPFFWAGFTVTGGASTLDMKNKADFASED